ncbi:hypothetical protein PF010_g16927 [Phytophthora fragariae]|uniref:Uncharacterized protein n=1 Tax=Phytophthora fragariae TaxID=53985 RepID=A0A6A4DI09_9STRA|nr:hypothetical protein PF009_g13835 [Phytophthora fragariae]KAE9094635.1 hypothetical protein PF007_g17691 [Phytophthora fragariae]KAE9094875.1 hypothetical protein PF010_g16927 [Phytophthora fragariae]KAE9306580.1 hypothetical protein PF001_g12054 [Phytophthora fragariae]
MAKIWKTGVAHSAALRGMPPVSSSRSRGRKPRSAANLRARKKARAARRRDAAEGEHTASRTPSEGTTAEDRASEAAGTSMSEASEPGERPQGKARKSVSGVTKVSVVCDNHAAIQAAVQPGASSGPAVKPGDDGLNCVADGDGACIICANSNNHAVADCANCNCRRVGAVHKTGDCVAIQDAVATDQAAIDTDPDASSTNQTTANTDPDTTSTTQPTADTDPDATSTTQPTVSTD